MKQLIPTSIRLFALTVSFAAFASLRPVLAEDALDPKTFGENAMKASHSNMVGEQFSWYAGGPAEELIMGYEATGDTRWLDESVTYNDFLISKLTKDPDGYEGWIGKSIQVATGRVAQEDYLTDALIGDANLLSPMVNFARIVKRNPDLANKYGAKAKQYTELAERIGWEKWNKRGAFRQDAAGFGSYHSINKSIDPKTNQWVQRDYPLKSENLNKHSGMAIILLRLWDITGKDEYRTQAYAVFARLKHMFRYFPEEDRISWNFWMPHGPYDVKPRAADAPVAWENRPLTEWVAVHPKQPAYQAIEVSRMVEAYDYGLVFDQADMQRLVNTNHFMVPSGTKGRGSDGSGPGTLWGSLARFDEGIRTSLQGLYSASAKGSGKLKLAYLNNVTMKQLGWDRLYVKDAAKMKLSTEPVMTGRVITATVVIPDKLETANDDKVKLITQTRGSGEIKIELLDSTGKDVLGELWKGDASAKGDIIMPEWDGTNPKTGKKDPGEYLIRWTLDKDVRTERVIVEVGQKHEPLWPVASAGAAAAAATAPEPAPGAGADAAPAN